MVFILDRLKEEFKDEEEEEDEGFDDMNYIIGNSSAMDVGEVPTPMDQRIGYTAMVGGKLMELQITNPATFELEGDKMIRTIDQLGLDITLHPDMNAGFCTAEKSARGEEYGYDTVEQYFTNYIQELAYFKKQVYGEENEEKIFNIGRMNPHISTSPKPSLQERMANDVGVDPFGFEIGNGDQDAMKARNYRGQNIWENEEFLRRVYYTFFVEEVEFAFQYYGMFGRYSNKFEGIWEDAQREATNKFYKHRTEQLPDRLYNEVQEKIKILRTAQAQDRGIETDWLDILDGKNIEFPFYTVVTESKTEEVEGPAGNTIERISEVEIIDIQTEYREVSPELLGERGFRSFQQMSQAVHRVENMNQIPEELLERIIVDIIDEENDVGLDNLLRTGAKDTLDEKFVEDLDKTCESLYNSLKSGFNELWTNDEIISIDAKIAALENHHDIQPRRIQEIAYEAGIEGEKTLDHHAEKVFMGEPEYFEKEGPEEDLELDKHKELLKNLIQNFEREMWKESNLFYKIIPAWMSQANQLQNDKHNGWKAPEFIWETLIEKKWKEKKDVDVNLDLTSPRNGIFDDEDEDTYHYLDLLEESEEFRMDVVAAVGACYAWGHYTQRKAQFDLKGRDFGLNGEDGSSIYTDMSEKQEVRDRGWTWVDWMNRFGLGVNLETMAGSPQMRFKVWRPKDIAVTAHAINLTARKKLEENGTLGGLDHIHGELDGCPAKFTIDMEHVATMGAPPMHEMEIFFKQEEKLAGSDWELEIDENKPVAKIMRQMHLMDPGVEAQRGTHHGAFERGNEQLYNQLYTFVKHGFARNENEPATVLFELAEHKDESSYMMRITMDLIQLGVKPEDLDPARVDPSKKPESEEEALIGRFYGIERENFTREWAKIEEHAFDPLKGLLEAEEFDYTYSSKAAVDQGQNRPQEWQGEEYR